MQSHQALRVLLYVISAVEGIAGIIFLFATGWALSFAPHTLGFPNASYLIALVKGVGIVLLALGYLLCVTAREPVRYVAIIDALTFILIAAAVLNIYAVFSLHLGAFYPATYLIARAVLQLVLAIALVALRPKEIRNTQPA